MDNGGLLGQLGINWQLLLSQAVNFFILLIILRFSVYKPLLAVIKKRTERIQEGLQKAKEADIRLQEVDVIAKGKLKTADNQSIAIITATEQKAKELEQELNKKTELRQKELMQQTALALKRQQEEAKQQVFLQALELVKKTLIKTVELSPKDIDEKLIGKAVLEVKKHEV